MKTMDKKRNDVDRRKFFKALAISGAAAAAGSVLTGCGGQPPQSSGGNPSGTVTLDLTKPENQSLASVGGTLALEANDLDGQGLLLVRESETGVAVFSRKCTHMGCTVGDFQDGKANCPCHGSQYSLDGSPVKGPAAAPLKKYKAVLSGTMVTISN